MSKLKNSREKLPDDRRIYLSRLNAGAKVETHSKICGPLQTKYDRNTREEVYPEIQAPLKALSRKLWRNAWSTKIACVNYGFSSRPKYLDHTAFRPQVAGPLGELTSREVVGVQCRGYASHLDEIHLAVASHLARASQS
ncbi:hypothetical protein C8J57DRAFT_1255192 [Mycena rebaudengoi]|nr:hypothetical protein C8J57DRAFT_1255192 [Mycena rebaudengoi]